jgi:methylated-DNA-[protein]-cysteine S-methyltransferase
MSKRRNAENDNADAALGFSKKANTSGKQATLSFALRPNQAGRLPSPPASEDEKRDLSPTIRKVKSHQALTPYRKRIYGALLSVPKGRYTTYAALSDFLGSSASAVGGGMRNNPFAPEVPCHRVLASDGSIGGFGGSWGADGENAGKKHELLSKEGVKFDSKGKVRGPPFEDFIDLLQGG